MEKINVYFASKTIDIAEHENYILLSNRVCYLDEPNGNGVCMPYDDPEAVAEMTKTLIDMPVVAKYVCDENGEPNLGGHEAYIDEESGEIAFDTVPIGVHTDAYIKEDTVTTFAGESKTLPCVFATQKIWKRNKNMVAAVMRLFSEGRLHNSWEVASTEYSFKEGIKYLNKYHYLGNCFLGDNVAPAFGESAKILSLSQNDNNAMLMVAEALAQDIAAGGKEKEEDMNIESAASEQKVFETTITAEEIAELTVDDIFKRLYAKLHEMHSGGWIAYIYPEEHYLLWHSHSADELTFVKHTYAVNGDEVEVGEGEEVKLVVSIAQINAEIAELNEALAVANASIGSMREEISALTPYREAYEKAEAERAEQERKNAVAEMRQYCIDSGRFSEAELDGEDMSALIENLDRDAINRIIAERLIAEMRNREPQKKTASVGNIKASLEVDESMEAESKISAFRSFLAN